MPRAAAPAPRVFGRGPLIRQLREALRADRRVALVGAGGLGKTAVARALAAGVGSEYPGGVCWASLGDHAGLNTETVRAALARTRPPGRVLVVLDDAADRDWLRTIGPELDAHDADSLICTRWPDIGDTGERAWNRVHVGPLGRDESIEFLAVECDLDADLAGRVASATEGRPLALRVAAAVLSRSPSVRVDALLVAELERSRASPALPGVQVTSLLRDTVLEPALALSYARLPRTRQKQFRALGAAPAHVPLPPELVAEVWSDGDVAEGLFGLLAAGLLDFDGSDFRIHRTLAAYALALARLENEENAIAVRYCGACLRLVERQSPNWETHARRACDLALGWVLRRGDWSDAETFLQTADPEAVRRDHNAPEIEALAAVSGVAERMASRGGDVEPDWLVVLAGVAHARGDRAAFEELRGRVAPPPTAPAATSATDLYAAPNKGDDAARKRLAHLTHEGWDHYLARRWAAAEDVYKAALALADRLGEEDGRIAVLNNWGELCRTTGRYAEAESMLTRAYDAIAPAERAKHPTLLHNLGLLHRDRHNLAVAREFLEQAVHAWDDGQSPKAVGSLSTLAGVCLDLHDLAAAEQHLARGRAVAERYKLATELGGIRSKLGDLARTRGRPLDALEHYQFALDEARTRKDPIDEGTARHHIGLTHLEMSAFDEAAVSLLAAVELSRAHGDRPGATVSAAWLGRAHLMAGRVEEALRWLTPAAGAQRDLGTIATEFTTRYDEARAFELCGRLPEAAAALERCVVIAGEVLGEAGAKELRTRFAAQLAGTPRDRATALRPGEMDGFLARPGRAKARGDEQEALVRQTFAALGGGDFPAAIEAAGRAADLARELGDRGAEGAARCNLAEAFRRSGRTDDAIDEFGRALELISADESNALADTHNNLALALMDARRMAEAVPHLEQTVRLKHALDRPGGAAIAERLLSLTYDHLERPAESAAHAREAARLYRQSGQPHEVPALLRSAGTSLSVIEDFEAAVREFREAVAVAREVGDGAEVARSLTGLGVILGFQLHRTAEAATALGEAVPLARRFRLGANELLGLTLDKLEEAAEFCRSGGPAAEAFGRGEEHFGQGEFREAGKHFELALTAGHDPIATRVALGAAALLVRELGPAAGHLAAVLEVEPTNPDALYWHAHLAFRREDYATALRDFDAAIAERERRGTLPAPEPVEFLTEKMGGAMARYFQHRSPPGVTPDYLDLHFARAQVLSLLSSPDAPAALDHLVATQPNRYEYREWRALVLRSAGRFAEAARELYDATELAPHHRDLYVQRARVFRAAGDPEGALEDYQWALRLSADDPEVRTEFGLTLLTLGEFGDAVENLRAATALAPDADEPRFWSAVALALSGDLPTAESVFERENETRPADVGVAAWRVILALLQRDGVRAAAAVRGAPDAAATQASFLFWSGVVATLDGRVDEARELLGLAAERAAVLDEPERERLRGRVAVALGDAAGATHHYTAAGETAQLLSLRLEIAFLDWLAAWLPASPAVDASADIRARLNARLAAQELTNTRG